MEGSGWVFIDSPRDMEQTEVFISKQSDQLACRVHVGFVCTVCFGCSINNVFGDLCNLRELSPRYTRMAVSCPRLQYSVKLPDLGNNPPIDITIADSAEEIFAGTTLCAALPVDERLMSNQSHDQQDNYITEGCHH